jgi:hypothetical protein
MAGTGASPPCPGARLATVALGHPGGVTLSPPVPPVPHPPMLCSAVTSKTWMSSHVADCGRAPHQRVVRAAAHKSTPAIGSFATVSLTVSSCRWRGGQPGAERRRRGCSGKSGFAFPILPDKLVMLDLWDDQAALDVHA